VPDKSDRQKTELARLEPFILPRAMRPQFELVVDRKASNAHPEFQADMPFTRLAAQG
jgi:hypothetical protein